MRLSLLDYVLLFEGRTPNDALKHSIKLAQHAEKLGTYDTGLQNIIKFILSFRVHLK